MSATYFQDFTRDNGLPVTVEYGVDGSYSPTTYSPICGAAGGDAPTFCIVDAWPSTRGHNLLARWRLHCFGRLTWRSRIGFAISGWLLRFDCWWRASLTDSEVERFEAYLAERHEDDPYEPEDYL
jgi:hypothetical protein